MTIHGFNEREDALRLKDIARTNTTEGGPTAGTELLPKRGGTSTASNDRVFKTPAGGVPAKTGTGVGGDPYIWGSAVCDEFDEVTGLANGQTETLYNMVSLAVAGDVQVKASLVGARWVIDTADCP